MKQNQDIAFLFDLDGVLIDSETRYSEIWGEIESRFPTGIADFPRVIKGTTLDNILSTYFNHPGVRKKVEHLLYSMEGEMQYDYCQGAAELLHRLRENGIPAAIVTSSDSKKMAHLYEQHPELLDSIEIVVKADDITRSKPDPEGYLLAASRLGVKPERCVVVEDSWQGLHAGRNAGALVAGITGTIGEERVSQVADIYAPSVGELNLQQIVDTLKTR